MKNRLKKEIILISVGFLSQIDTHMPNAEGVSDVCPAGHVMQFALRTMMFCGFAAK
ncbi:MAG: hypothetical protein K6F68_00120 [Clostridiales bacterium]|nr:hypothetical protein [Clostridiales bacterium]